MIIPQYQQDEATESVDMQLLDLNDSSLENVTAAIPQINTTGIVMQSTAYSCGPAALATVLQNMGINSTEQKLKVLAGTDKSGTSMYGLAQAAQSKGLSAAGMELSVDELKKNNIVHIVIDGTPHFSVVREITDENVKLSDPKLGNIEMTRGKFSEIFTGHALVISNPNNLIHVNGTDQTNQSTEDTDSGELEKLTAEDMLTIQGGGGVNRVVRRRGGFRVYLCNITTQNIVTGKYCIGAIAGLIAIWAAPTGIPAKVIGTASILISFSAHLLERANAYNRGVRAWFKWVMGRIPKPILVWVDAQRARR